MRLSVQCYFYSQTFLFCHLFFYAVSACIEATNSSKCDVSAKDVSETLCAVCAQLKKKQISFHRGMLQVTLLSNLYVMLNYCCSQTAHRQHSAAEIRELTSLFFWLISMYMYI